MCCMFVTDMSYTYITCNYCFAQYELLATFRIINILCFECDWVEKKRIFFVVFHMSTIHCRLFPINLLLTILKEIINLQKIKFFSVNKLRLIRWTRTDDQSETNIRALQYIQIALDISLILYGQPSTYRFLAYIT